MEPEQFAVAVAYFVLRHRQNNHPLKNITGMPQMPFVARTQRGIGRA